MLAIGLSMRLTLPREELEPLAAGLVLKLAVMPALGLVPLLGLHGAMAHTTVLGGDAIDGHRRGPRHRPQSRPAAGRDDDRLRIAADAAAVGSGGGGIAPAPG